MRYVKLYADGACSGNPGPGGYGVYLKQEGGKFGLLTKEIYRGFRHTTNNRMELMGVIAGLEAVKEGWKIEVYTDSKYVVDAINKGWAVKWRSNGWKRNKREYALNTDLWENLLFLLERRTVTFFWVKGHSGHPENEHCDRLARRAIKESQYWQEDVREE